jgi:hypothetical protein
MVIASATVVAVRCFAAAAVGTRARESNHGREPLPATPSM